MQSYNISCLMSSLLTVLVILSSDGSNLISAATETSPTTNDDFTTHHVDATEDKTTKIPATTLWLKIPLAGGNVPLEVTTTSSPPATTEGSTTNYSDGNETTETIPTTTAQLKIPLAGGIVPLEPGAMTEKTTYEETTTTKMLAVTTRSSRVQLVPLVPVVPIETHFQSTIATRTTTKRMTFTTIAYTVDEVFPGLIAEVAALSSISTKEIVDNCPAISPLNRGPPQRTDGATNAFPKFTIDRLVSVKDLGQSMAVAGQLYTRWSVPTCGAVEVNGVIIEPQRIMLTDIGKIWHPPIGFNSVDDISMKSRLVFDRLEMVYIPDADVPHKSSINFYWKRRGIFEAVFAFDLTTFPFDIQSWDFVFDMLEPSHIVKFDQPLFPPLVQNANGAIDMWSIISQHVHVGNYGRDNSSKVTFTLVMKRNPGYFIFNLLGPCYILTFLALCTFIMPPRCTDRFCFNVYLVLALTVCFTNVTSVVPQTSQSVLINDYVQLLGVTCIYCTVWSIFMLWLVCNHPTCRKRRNSLFTARLVLDVLGFIGACAIFLLSTIYTASKAKII